jgi:nitrite reductase/ring-hydroxylating ferredoxin subunit
LSKRLIGRRLVAFRVADGTISVMDAHCAHLGADLGLGRVLGETLQCPFHNWSYGADGVCKHIPGMSEIPRFARVRTYPATERHGYIFVFSEPRPSFPLPFFFGEDPGAFVAGGLFRYVADCNWYMNAAHAFDMQHFAAVHDRQLLAPPVVDCPVPFARRNRYRAKVIGRSVFDRVLRATTGDVVEISITVFGGPFVLVTGDFGRVESRFMITTQPLDDGRTLCEGIVFARRGRVPLLDGFGLKVRRLFTHGYLAAESRQLRGTRYNPAGLGPQDRDMIEFFRWAADLPQATPNAHQPIPNGGRDERMDQGAAAPLPSRYARAVASAPIGSATIE